MDIKVLNESGYNEAALGFSLSWNSTIQRAKELLPLYAHKGKGENKYLETIQVWLMITAPRFWWQEFDTYRVGITKQSESTMHTITKRDLTQDDFEYEIPDDILSTLNIMLSDFRQQEDKDLKKNIFLMIKNSLPEGFLQMRIVNTNYKTLQNMYVQRINHRLPEWKYFLTSLLLQVEHPEFIKG